MLNRKVTFLWFLLVTAGVGFGYPTWINVYDGHGMNTIEDVLPLSNGHTVFAATCDSTPAWDGTWAAEIDENGDILWNFYHPMPPRGLAEIEGEGYLLLTGLYNGQLIRLDLSGNQVWSIPVGYSLDHLVRTADGNYVYRDDDVIRMVDSNGSTIWTVDPPQPEYIAALGPSYSPSGGFAVNGSRYDPTKMYFMGGTADSTGAIQAVGEYYTGGDMLYFLGTYSDIEGNCYGIAQYVNSYPPPTSDEHVIRFDTSGNISWNRIVNGTVDICQSADGNTIVAGTLQNSDIELLFLRKMNSANGGTIWETVHGLGSDYFSPYCVGAASDGGFVVGGTSLGLAALAKTDSLGLINGMGIQDTPQSELHIRPLSNPSFSSSLSFEIGIPQGVESSLCILDATGRVVHTDQLHNTASSVSFDRSGLPPGVYIAVLSSDSFGRAFCRMILLDQTQ